MWQIDRGCKSGRYWQRAQLARRITVACVWLMAREAGAAARKAALFAVVEARHGDVDVQQRLHSSSAVLSLGSASESARRSGSSDDKDRRDKQEFAAFANIRSRCLQLWRFRAALSSVRLCKYRAVRRERLSLPTATTSSLSGRLMELHGGRISIKN